MFLELNTILKEKNKFFYIFFFNRLQSQLHYGIKVLGL